MPKSRLYISSHPDSTQNPLSPLPNRLMASRDITPTPPAASVQTCNTFSGTPFSSNQKNANKRRFSDQQIKFLEFMFESESRPESQLKQQLAGELGLQPRQIAIWFQNRRARLKSKQIEKEYNTLKESYDALASSFETLKRENQSLLTQLQKLKNLHIKRHGGKDYGSDQTESSSDGTCKSRVTNSDSEERPCLPLEDHKSDVAQNDQKSRTIESIREETDMLNLTEYTDGLMTSSGWHSFGSNCFLDESSSSSKWWEFFS